MVKLAARNRHPADDGQNGIQKSRPKQLRAAITPNTRLFILNSPSNPTGSVYTPEETKALGESAWRKTSSS